MLKWQGIAEIRSAISRQFSHEHRAYKYHNCSFNNLFPPSVMWKRLCILTKEVFGAWNVHLYFLLHILPSLIYFPPPNYCSVMLLGLLSNRSENSFCLSGPWQCSCPASTQGSWDVAQELFHSTVRPPKTTEYRAFFCYSTRYKKETNKWS